MEQPRTLRRAATVRSILAATVLARIAVLGTNRVFVAADDGRTIVTLDAVSGVVRRVYRSGGFVSDVAVDTRTGTLLLATLNGTASGGPARGSVRVLDEATGTVLRVVAVGMGPLRVAVDDADRRAVTVNYNDGTASIIALPRR